MLEFLAASTGTRIVATHLLVLPGLRLDNVQTSQHIGKSQKEPDDDGEEGFARNFQKIVESLPERRIPGQRMGGSNERNFHFHDQEKDLGKEKEEEPNSQSPGTILQEQTRSGQKETQEKGDVGGQTGNGEIGGEGRPLIRAKSEPVSCYQKLEGATQRRIVALRRLGQSAPVGGGDPLE